MQKAPPTQVCPDGQHWHGQGTSPLRQVMRTQRPPEQTSSQRHPPGQPAGEQKYRALFIGSRVHVSPLPQVPGHCAPHPSAVPQATPERHVGTHTQRRSVASQLCPVGHSRPVPHEGCAGQRLGMSVPQATAVGSAVHAGTHVQTPFTQAVPVPQRTPQPPQLASSLPVRTHVDPQSVKPVGHAQRPPTQVVPLGHAALQAPQLFASVCAFTQRPLQSVKPVGQRHTPAVQVVPAGQLTPHAPQLALSALTFTHTPPHSVVPGAHTQRPPVQLRPLGQSVPVPGQFVPVHVLGIVAPHATVFAAGHVGTHSQLPVVLLQRSPVGHRVPTPHTGPPLQRFGIGVPHATVAG